MAVYPDRIRYTKTTDDLTSVLKQLVCQKLSEYPEDFKLSTGPRNEANAWCSANNGCHVRITIEVFR